MPKHKLKFDNSYSRLPDKFYQEVLPTKVKESKLIKFNTKLAEDLGLNEFNQEELAEIFSGNKVLESFKPIAQAYAGHQFGNFVPQLGDGRAILLAEIINKNGKRKDIQLKGSGQTKFSRRGDGRAWLGPVIREYIVSEAMHALNVPTTRSLAMVSTGETIIREQILPGAILTRVASSHIRVGTFEYFAARNDQEALKQLADYTIDRHYPEAKQASNPYLSLLEQVSIKQQELITDWLRLGFIHGVMNTDNCSIAGETIDYGPCAFMDFYHPNQVFSSIDSYGRYAYGNQANIALWNLHCFANTLLGLINKDKELAREKAGELLSNFAKSFEEKAYAKLLYKIGFKTNETANIEVLTELLELMKNYRADFTLTFSELSKVTKPESDPSKLISLFDETNKSSNEIKSWLKKWQSMIDPEQAEELMKVNNPIYIPRNHLIEEVIHNAHQHNDFTMMHQLIDCLSKPFDEQEGFSCFTEIPIDKDFDYVTFCGT